MHFRVITVPLPNHPDEGLNGKIPFFATTCLLVMNVAVVVLMLGTQGHLPDQSFEQDVQSHWIDIAEIERQTTAFGNLGGEFMTHIVGGALQKTILPDGLAAVRQTVVFKYGKHERGHLCQGGVALPVAHAASFGFFRHGSIKA